MSRKAPSENFPVFHCFLYNLYMKQPHWCNIQIYSKVLNHTQLSSYISMIAGCSMVSVDFFLVVKDYI